MQRTFAALSVPREIADTLIGQASRLGGDQPRWVDPATAHLTLAFLGSLPNDEVEKVVHALGQIRQDTFEMQLTKASTFPSRRSPRVVVVEATEAPELRRLYESVGSCLSDWLPAERRDYRPHVTLARVNRGRDIDTSNLVRALEALLPQTIRMTEFVLYESTTRSDRAYYEIITSFALGSK